MEKVPTKGRERELTGGPETVLTIAMEEVLTLPMENLLDIHKYSRTSAVPTGRKTCSSMMASVISITTTHLPFRAVLCRYWQAGSNCVSPE